MLVGRPPLPIVPANSRQPGFYWVRLLGSSEHPDGWTIGEWTKGHSREGDTANWRLPGCFFTHRDRDLQEIDEHQIDRGRTRSWRNVRA